MIELKAGDALILETGEYSDFSYSGPFRVLKPLRLSQALLDECRAAFLPSYPGAEFRPDDIGAALNRLGYVEDMETTSVHVGSYGDIDTAAFPA
jgi:hypothetical protein